MTSAALGMICALSAGDLAQAATTTTTAKHKHAHAPAGPDLAQQVKDLQAQVEALQQTMAAQTQAQQQSQAQTAQAIADSQAQAAQATATARAAQAKLDMQIEQIPGAVQTAVAAQPKPPTDKFYYKGITITPGGFLEAATIWRSSNLGSDMASSFAKVPFGNAALSHAQEFRVSGRQSRVSFLAEGNINQDMKAAFYGEFDFLGAAQTANSNESNSYNPRIRNVYGTVDWDSLGLHVLGGQNWSLITLNSKGITPRNEVTPTAIDAQYVPGFAWARQPQIRLVKDFADKQAWIAVSAENPQSTFTGTAGNALPTGISVTDLVTGNTTINGAPAGSVASSGFNTVNTMSLNKLPDFVAKLAIEPEIMGSRPLHAEVFGLYRDFYDQITVTSANTIGLKPGVREAAVDGGGVGGSITLTVWPKRLDLQGSFLTGKGIGRYGSAQLSDATLNANGEIAPIHETMFLGGATFHATPKLDLYIYGGEEKENSQISAVGTTNFGFGDLAGTNFTDAGCKTIGGACSATVRQVDQITAGLWDKAITGPYGQIRLGLQYSHTWLTGFAGPNGFAPTTSEDMVFTSFRYYPF
ncbi:hypothetical protein [Phenylobacterium sp.]|uniref:hypothetical protein n=1 Tax=Phenylobacterium sp. TaxID=1871053 RepID=UPI00120F7C1F|nr:hypothetical protein [Phenylobacterium sp.]THD61007.1 MAG: hypothetical protein E8A49_12115 [Phenylobacterium sp.]